MTSTTNDWRLELRVRKRALRDYMTYRGETIRSLAMKAGVTKSTIGNMHSWSLQRGVECPPALAARIEAILDAPPGSIFEAKVSRVARNDATQHQQRPHPLHTQNGRGRPAA